MDSFDKLAADMRKLNKRIPEFASEKASDLSQRIAAGLIGSTPVDTSKALSNWQIGVNEEPDEEVEAYVPGSKGSSQAESAQIAYLKAKKELERKKPREPIYIVNNVEYIDDLNAGKSPQAPAGFVEFQVEFQVRSFEGQKWELEL